MKTTQPSHRRPTSEETNAAIETLAANIAWEEWDSEPEREIDDINEYCDGLMDLIGDREMGAPEITEAAARQLGLEPFGSK